MQKNENTNKYDDIASYHPKPREIIKISIMFGTMLTGKYFIKDKPDTSFITVVDKTNNNAKALHWALVLYGYIIPHITDEAFDLNITDIDQQLDIDDELMCHYAVMNEPPIQIVWDLFKQIQEIKYPNSDMDFVVEASYVYYQESNRKATTEDCKILALDFDKDAVNRNTKPENLAVLVPKPKVIDIKTKKTIVKGFVAEINKPTNITANHSKQEL